ncbi:hypothetical protein BH10ACT8_BH10ACT8_02660 [soil metagenome]
MSLSAISGATSPAASHYAEALRASIAAKSQAGRASGGVDADGDHDGSSSASTGRLDVKA